MRKPNKCDSILDAASEVFLENGYEKTKIQEIAKKAGVGKGTVYEYFTSKEELFSQMIKHNVSCMNDDIMGIFEHSSSMQELLETFVDKAIIIIRNYGQKLSFVIYEDFSRISSELQEWLIEKQQHEMEHISKVLQQFIEKNEIRNINPEVAAWMIQDIIRLGFYFKVIRKQENVEELMRAEIDIILNGTRGSR